MNIRKILLLVCVSLCLSPALTLNAYAKRKGFVNVKSVFNKPQNVANATYSEDTDANYALVNLGGRRKFTSASIILDFTDLLDEIVAGAEFTEVTTGETEIAGLVNVNLLASKFKNDSGFSYTTYQDDESTIRDASVKILSINPKGLILLKVKATFDNVKLVDLDSDSNEINERRVDGITASGMVKYDPSNPTF